MGCYDDGVVLCDVLVLGVVVVERRYFMQDVEFKEVVLNKYLVFVENFVYQYI